MPDEPGALADALPYLGSSIREFSPERSWPSLRGHPPAIEPGTGLDVPAGLAKPDTGITVTVPPSRADLYRVAPLVFYLGADVEIGDRPALHLANGYSESLGASGHDLETTVDRLLGKCLLLDSLVRVGGYYSVPRYEYEELAPHLPFYPPNLYDRSLSAQLMEYLEVSTEVLEPYLPRWPTTAVLRSDPADVSLLSPLLDSLSRIHVDEGPNRKANGTQATAGASRSLVTAHVGEPPPGASRLVPRAFEHARSRTVPVRDEATVTVVTADPERARAFRERTGDGGVAPASVMVHRRPTRAALRDAIAAPTDFLCLDLPATAAGIQCDDGVLPPESVETVGATMVGLHGEESLDVGTELVERGAVAGVVFEESPAIDLLTGLSKVLLAGHALAASAEAVGLAAETDHRFVGDAAHVLAHIEGAGVPVRVDVDSVAPDEHELAIWAQTTDRHRLGGISRFAEPYAPAAYQLHGARVEPPYRISTAEVVDLLADDATVVRLNGELVHSDEEASAADVRESARRNGA